MKFSNKTVKLFDVLAGKKFSISPLDVAKAEALNPITNRKLSAELWEKFIRDEETVTIIAMPSGEIIEGGMSLHLMKNMDFCLFNVQTGELTYDRSMDCLPFSLLSPEIPLPDWVAASLDRGRQVKLTEWRSFMASRQLSVIEGVACPK